MTLCHCFTLLFQNLLLFSSFLKNKYHLISFSKLSSNFNLFHFTFCQREDFCQLLTVNTIKLFQFNLISSQMSFHHRISLGNCNCFIGLCFVLWFVFVGEAVPLSIGHHDSTLQIYPKAMFNSKFNDNFNEHFKVSIILVIHLIFFIDKFFENSHSKFRISKFNKTAIQFRYFYIIFLYHIHFNCYI